MRFAVFATVAVAMAWLDFSVPTAASPARRKELCSLGPVLHNSTFPARRADGFRVCPAAFSAELVELEDGTFYGACYKLGGATARSKIRMTECREACRKLGADLPVLPRQAVEAYAHTRFLDGLGPLGRFDYGFWLGATDHLAEGNWTWLDGGAPVVNANWDA